MSGWGVEIPTSDTGELACTSDAVEYTTEKLGCDTDTWPMGSCEGEKPYEASLSEVELGYWLTYFVDYLC